MPFISFSYLIGLSVLYWENVEGMAILVSMLILQEHFPLLSVMLAAGLSCVAFLVLRYAPFVTTLQRLFIINKCWILSNAFEIITWSLSSVLLMWCITLINLQILKHPCIPGINHAWSWCVILLMYYWIQSIIIIFCWGFLCQCPSEILAYNFHFSNVFIWFWYHGNAVFLEWVQKYSFFFSILGVVSEW